MRSHRKKSVASDVRYSMENRTFAPEPPANAAEPFHRKNGLAAPVGCTGILTPANGDDASPSLPGAGHKYSKFELEVHRGELSRSRAIWSSAQAGRRRRYLRYRSEWLRRLRRLGVRSRTRIDAVAVADLWPQS